MPDPVLVCLIPTLLTSLPAPPPPVATLSSPPSFSLIHPTVPYMAVLVFLSHGAMAPNTPLSLSAAACLPGMPSTPAQPSPPFPFAACACSYLSLLTMSHHPSHMPVTPSIKHSSLCLLLIHAYPTHAPGLISPSCELISLNNFSVSHLISSLLSAPSALDSMPYAISSIHLFSVNF